MSSKHRLLVCTPPTSSISRRKTWTRFSIASALTSSPTVGMSVENGVVSLKLQGACGSCPSSTTTMKMGIERVLKEKFGAIKDVCQVNDEQIAQTSVDAVNSHLDILRPAIKNYGGSVQVLSVDGGECLLKYIGPEKQPLKRNSQISLMLSSPSKQLFGWLTLLNHVSTGVKVYTGWGSMFRMQTINKLIFLLLNLHMFLTYLR